MKDVASDSSGSWGRSAGAGAAIWLLLSAVQIALQDPGFEFEIALSLGPLVVAPLGFRLLAPSVMPRTSPLVQRALATAACGSLLLDPWPGAPILAMGWVAFCALVALRSVASRDLLSIAACGYLTVGAAWLVIGAGDFQVAGIGEPISTLTGVHFHFAGFGALVIAICTVRFLSRSRSVSAAAAWGIVLAMPVIASGFTFSVGELQFVGAALLAVALCTLAVVTLRSDIARGSAPLVIASVLLVGGMALAVHWAGASTFGYTPLSYEVMARTHGVLNATFVVLSLIGWSRVAARS